MKHLNLNNWNLFQINFLVTLSLLLLGCTPKVNDAIEGFNNGTKIIRGVNICPLTAQKIADSYDPPIGTNEPVENLSVRASADRNISYDDLARGLPNANYSFTTLGELRKACKHILIVADPLPGNPYHCLIDVITPRQMASKMGGNCRNTPPL